MVVADGVTRRISLTTYLTLSLFVGFVIMIKSLNKNKYDFLAFVSFFFTNFLLAVRACGKGLEGGLESVEVCFNVFSCCSFKMSVVIYKVKDNSMMKVLCGATKESKN